VLLVNIGEGYIIAVKKRQLFVVVLEIQALAEALFGQLVDKAEYAFILAAFFRFGHIGFDFPQFFIGCFFHK
jgi:hypothetical protein